jgi:hypothetical protein
MIHRPTLVCRPTTISPLPYDRFSSSCNICQKFLLTHLFGFIFFPFCIYFSLLLRFLLYLLLFPAVVFHMFLPLSSPFNYVFSQMASAGGWGGGYFPIYLLLPNLVHRFQEGWKMEKKMGKRKRR